MITPVGSPAASRSISTPATLGCRFRSMPLSCSAREFSAV
jgi:hypothetical protein